MFFKHFLPLEILSSRNQSNKTFSLLMNFFKKFPVNPEKPPITLYIFIKSTNIVRVYSMSEKPREIDEKQLQEIFKRMSRKQQKSSADESPDNSEYSSSSRNKTRTTPSSGIA